jgi:hypothetical protein
MVQKSVLIFTPFADFGELISQSISRNESCTVSSFSTVKAVADFICNNQTLHFALLDIDIGFGKVKESVFIIRDKFPSAEIILISKKDLPKEAKDLRPWRLLKKPFIESDLLELFKNPNDFQQSQVIDGVFQNTAERGMPVWATDRNELERILSSTVTKLDVVDAFICSKDGILAQTGKISDIEISDCSWIIHKYFDGSEKGELLKQIHLTTNTFILHGTILAIGIILAILYNEETPYKIVRSQTRYLTAMILNPRLSAEGTLTYPERTYLTKDEGIIQSFSEDSENEIVTQKQIKKQPRPAKKFKRNRVERTIEERFKPEEEETNPTFSYVNHDLYPGPVFESPPEVNNGGIEAVWSLKVPDPDPIPAANKSRAVHEKGPEGDKTIGSPVTTDQYYGPSKMRDKDESEDERVRDSFLQPAQGLSYINYACLLIPRLKSCLIASDLARFLNEEIPNIFLAYGWRLENLIIDKTYLQWVVRLPSSVAPSTHIRTIRRESSKMVLSNFTRLSRDGLITDYWAPGFLLESGRRPIPGNEIRDFIRVTRELYYPDDRISHIPESNYSPANF